MKTGRYVGVGVDEYDAATLKRLDYAVRDVQELRALLGASFAGEPLPNPDEQAVRKLLRDLKDSMRDDPKPLVFQWSGHGIPSQVVPLRLLARDSDPAKDDGLDIVGDLGSASAQSGANQILLIIDTCYSGNAISAASVVAAVMQTRPPDAEHLWVGVLASCLPIETARDGLLGRKLLELLKDGPKTPYMKVRWSAHNERIRGDDLCDALLKEWNSEVQRPQYEGNGDAWWMLPNPLYKAGAPEQVVEHLLLAARGGAREDERSWFTGRTAEVDRVVEWVHSGRPGMHVVSGSAGTGKSAIVGRVVSLSNPQEREHLFEEERTWRHADPGERSVQAHIHARGLTADRAADLLGEELVRCDVLTRQEERRNASELVGQVQRAVETDKPPPVVVVDGLDEARGEAFTIAEDLLRRLAEHAVVIVSTREVPRGEEQESLVATLTPRGAELDLDDPEIRDRGRADMRDYLVARLADVDERMDGAAVAGHFIHVTPMTGGSPFLLARLVADRLTESPIDTAVDDLREQVSGSIDEALEADLARVEARDDLDLPRGTTATELARKVLAALTWGLGAGFPEDEWLCVARALVPDLTEDRDVLAWVLEQLGRYVVQDGEDGVAVYRLAHQSLADHLHQPYRGTHEQPFDPAALRVAEALLARYATLLDGGVPVRQPAYLWRYAWSHAALAGPRGLDLLRSLAQSEMALVPDVGAAASSIAEILNRHDRKLDAVSLAEEAVATYRALAHDNPAFTGNLAGALNNLGNLYSEVGRPKDAIPPAEEAVTTYRALAHDNPAFTGKLATALNNLGSRYSEVGRPKDALPPAEEAVATCRALANDNPAFTGDLAMALNNLGSRYSEVGRPKDAIPPAEEAVTTYRALAHDNPAFTGKLAGALNNLGSRYSEVGRPKDALPPAEEAVTIYRALANNNPAFTGNLAMALNNLGSRYSEVGRPKDALPPAEEAVTIYRALAHDNPAFTGKLATALNNLGNRYSEVGRPKDAIPPVEEAVATYRALARESLASTIEVARALNNLERHCKEVGEPERADVAWKEALDGSEPLAGAELLLARASRADAGEPRAVTWLATAISLAGEHRGLLGALHDQARRHRDADTTELDRHFKHATGKPPPQWLTVDRSLLASALAWVETDTYSEERDYLDAHSELLDPTADIAVREALLRVPDNEAQRYRALRESARAEGVEAAYRPLLLTLLARGFMAGDTQPQRALLAERRADLLDEVVVATIDAAATENQQDPRPLRARALLELAALGEDAAVLDALEEPACFPTLLATLAARPTPDALAPAALVAGTAATTPAHAAEACFFLAVATAIADEGEQASELLAQARRLDETQSPAWIARLADLGKQHPAVLSLIGALAAPLDPAAASPEEAQADGDDAPSDGPPPHDPA